MTNANTTPANGSTTTKQHRRLKVKRGWYDYQGRQTRQQQSTIAEILLKGKWLADAGFTVDSNVDISIEDGRLVITSV
jgi:hypothetical protein